ncbi:MAG: PadR family transcriptional regulator [Ktedonobacterales bacterium]
METQAVSWPSEFTAMHDLSRYLMRMSQGREERSRHERHEESESSRHRTERSGRRERGGRERHRVGRGDVYAATLLLLDEQALHGYQIIQLIEERSGGNWRPSAGSVYPALQLLEDQGYIQGEQQESRRVFHLTESGRAYIREHRTELVAARDAVTARMDSGDAELLDVFNQVETAFKQVVHVGTAVQLAAARELLVNARRQLYRILADDEEQQPL